ncbi:hypothetical protein MKW98_029620 [Papaver atlanticum]|uniref:Uncharacterized protein n=1 Tax=Papaver atlanticum TaxID=357466 RepID=A0AAD4T6B6_9MAGN|nr:hypothetical protein MKW98_029620 [Papaver atlanticum]
MWRLTFYKLHRNRKQGEFHLGSVWNFVKGLQNLLDENDLVVILAAPHRLAASMSSSICYTSRSQSTLSWVVVQECF